MRSNGRKKRIGRRVDMTFAETKQNTPNGLDSSLNLPTRPSNRRDTSRWSPLPDFGALVAQPLRRESYGMPLVYETELDFARMVTMINICRRLPL